MTDIIDRLRSDPITDPAHTSQLIVEAVREIELLRAKVEYLNEAIKAQDRLRSPDASGSYSGTGSAY